MILNELNQLLKESVAKVATKNALTLDQKLLEQVEFEISAEQLRGDYASSCSLKLSKNINKKSKAQVLLTYLSRQKQKGLY